MVFGVFFSLVTKNGKTWSVSLTVSEVKWREITKKKQWPNGDIDGRVID